MTKTILITGVSSGLGKATARFFAHEGWNVVATMRRPEEERELVQIPNVLVTRLDVQDRISFVTHTNAVFEGLREVRQATEEDVAKVIYQAATDGTDCLRYVATQDIKPMVKARRETSEDEYIAFMRTRFGVKVQPGYTV